MNSVIFLLVIFLQAEYLQVSNSASVGTSQDNQGLSEQKAAGNGSSSSSDPVYSYGLSSAVASASGTGSFVETNSWNAVDNHGGLHVEAIAPNGTETGFQVYGVTNCSQESLAFASGSLTAAAYAEGLCNSSVLLDQPVSNLGVNLTKTE